MVIITCIVVGAIAAGIVRLLTKSSLYAGMTFFFITMMVFKFINAHSPPPDIFSPR